MAILTFLFRVRIAVLAILSLATAAAAWVTFHDHPVPVGALFPVAASLAIGCIAAFVHLRQAGLAVVAALAPVPGMIAAAPLFAAASTAVLLAIYGLALATAACLAGGIVRRILDAASPEDAARDVLARSLAPGSLAAVVAAMLIGGWLFRDARALALGSAVEIAAALTSALLFVPFAAAVLRFGEPFFVTANRARERRESALRIATQIVEPRWAFAASGAALTLATLGWFGAEPFIRHSALVAQPTLWGASVLLTFLATLAAGRDWRDALAATATLSTLTLLALFLWGKAVGHITASSFVEIVAVESTALLLTLALIMQSRRYRLSGDNAQVARLRALEDAGWAPWFGTAGAAAAVLPWVLVHGSIAALAVLMPLACAAALLGLPALATVLETLLPRRRSVDQLYGRG